MRPKYLLPFIAVLFIALIPFIPSSVSGQSGVASRISAAIDNTKLTTLHGNVHPMARSEFDRGAAPASLPMEHMQLVLTRSADQQTALETLLAQQQNPSSPNYHNWLTPEQFGQQFGASDQDIQKITSWLQSQGFQVNEVAKGRGTIDFSGNAGQVQSAFHTAIHSYVLPSGEQHWANSTDPQIPTALAPVVAGVSSLNNFPRKPMSRRVHPNVTLLGAGCNGSGTNCYAVGPADFATIYNSQALLTAGINGSGQTIAIVSDSDINSADVNNFRSLFGLSAINLQRVIPTGSTNPGIQNNNNNSDEVEADLDVQWSGAVAPGATIDLVLAPTTNTAFGGDTAAIYIVDNNVAPILSYSYGACELALGTSGNAFYQGLWSQAAGEGISVLVSTGDSGAAGCDDPNVNSPADFGLQVNGVGSTPYNIAVGGTDFNDFSNPTTYWNNSNSTGLASAKGYIPEIAYNDSCANSIIYSTVLNFSGAEAACNSATARSDNFLAPAGGSGGASNCTTNSTTSTTVNLNASSCSGGYAKPSWQTGVGVPADGKRDVPDVSLFAGDGTIQNFYLICQSDQNTSDAACTSTSLLEGIGGTSASVQAFAGITAMINQQTGGRQGNFNPTLYSLAAAQSASSCNSTSSPSSSCVFYDTTVGTIAMPCDAGTPNCVVNTSGDTIGILSGFNTGVGFDLATGLGSMNIGNLINRFPNFSLSSSVTSFTVSSTTPGTSTVTVTSQNGFTGTINLSCGSLPTGASCSFNPSSVTLSANGTATSALTITRTSSLLTPSLRRNSPNNAVAIGAGAALLMLGLLITFRTRQRSAAFALITLAALVTLASCGGGSSSSTNSGSSTSSTGSTSSSSSGNASIAGTTPSGTVPGASHTLAITVTVQ